MTYITNSCILAFTSSLIDKLFSVILVYMHATFCLGEKEGMLANDECSPWYNKVGDF